jgi:alkyl hydroperoxide reductase subunit AhpC
MVTSVGVNSPHVNPEMAICDIGGFVSLTEERKPARLRVLGRLLALSEPPIWRRVALDAARAWGNRSPATFQRRQKRRDGRAFRGKPRGMNMAFQIGDIAPDFEAQTTQGPIRFHDWAGDSWVVFFSHPKDFTPVCTTELGYVARMKPEFDRRNVKLIGLSVDPIDNHSKWAADIQETQGAAPNYPMIGDPDLSISKLYGMLPASASGDASVRTPADNQTVRNVFVIGPDKKIKLIIVYPMTTGRNFDEVLRVIDSLQLTAKHKVATPVNWKPGEDVIIAGSVSDEEAKKVYPQGWNAPRPYLRIVPQPR